MFKKESLRKLILLNLFIILLNIILFSNAFLHIDLSGGNDLLSAFGITMIVMSIILFGYGNYTILFPKEKPDIVRLKDKDIITLEICTEAVAQYINSNIKTFHDDLNKILNQIRRFGKKKISIREILLDKFSDTEMSFSKFNNVVERVENIMLLNIKSLLNRLYAFDEEEFENILKDYLPKSKLGNLSKTELSEIINQHSLDKVTESRLSIYNECVIYADKVIENNEEILIKLDRLLIEISKLNDFSGIEEMNAMKEIDEMINNTKWYKQN